MQQIHCGCEAFDVSCVHWRKVLSANFCEHVLHKSQRELTCSLRTSLSSGRNLTEAVVSLCNSCKLDSVPTMTVNLRILTGSSQDPLAHGRFFPHGAHGSLPGKDGSLGVWRLVGFQGSLRSCKANVCFIHVSFLHLLK